MVQIKQLVLMLAVAGAAGAAWAIPQDQMDQLHSFFCGTTTAAGGVLIAIQQPPKSITPEQQKMAQMISVCHIQKQHQQSADVVNINGAGCPIVYFSETAWRPQSDGSITSSIAERDVLSSVDTKILTGLSQYSSVVGTTTTTTNSTTGAFSAQAGGHRRYVGADGSMVVTMQVGSVYSGVKSVITSDKEDYTINFGGQTYTAENFLNGTQTTCTLNGLSSSCDDFNYVMCVNP